MNGRVRLPADIELEDKLAFGLNARQLGLLALSALGTYSLFALAAPLLPAPVAVALAAPLALVGALLALGRRDGLSADRLALAAARFFAQPRRRVLASEPLPDPQPRAFGWRRSLGRLDLPVRTVRRSGLVELEDGSSCILLRATSAAFALRSEEEQEALVAGFARFLNGLSEPIQIVIRSEPIQLSARAAELDKAADSLTDPALQEAARDHARFLTALEREEEVRQREIILVLITHARAREAASVALQRRSADAVELLRPAGVELQLLDGNQTAALLARALDPPGPPDGSQLGGVIRRS